MEKLFILLLFCVYSIRSQEPPAELKGARFRVLGGLILNRGYSNVKSGENETDNSVEKWTAGENGKKIKAGFVIGGEMLFFPKESFKAILGASISQSSAEYHYSYISLSQSSRPGFTDLLKETEYDYRDKFTALNLSAGIRNQLNENLFLSSMFVLYSPFRTVRSFTGYNRSTYSNNSGAEERSTVFLTEPPKKVKGAANLSLQFRLEYQVMIGNRPASFFLSRNLGMVYKLPWWIIGMTYSL